MGRDSVGLFVQLYNMPAPNPCVCLLQLVMFRTYLDYHIKAAKAYLHARMRSRVDGWLTVLNRAQPDEAFGGKEKKTAGGKAFVASARAAVAVEAMTPGGSAASSPRSTPRG